MTPAERTRAIIARVAEHHGVTLAEITGPTRQARSARARTEAAWVLRRLTGQTKSQIGPALNRHPSTVVSAIARVEERRAADPDFVTAVDQLVDQIRRDFP